MRTTSRVITTATLTATLLASLVASLLPNGCLPKVAGPCGRELCSCATAVYPFVATEARCLRVPTGQSSTGLQYVAVDQPGLASFEIFCGVLRPARFEGATAAHSLVISRPLHRSFSLSDCPTEIDLPPPRA